MDTVEDRPAELVVLLDDAGSAIGTAEKAAVHHRDTPLHLAFSCYVFDRGGRLLITQRALDKTVFPALWTNSVCGHPGPGEELGAAVRRRAEQELGLRIEPRLVLPGFRYRAEMDGVVEHEWCPVYAAVLDEQEVRPDPTEVEAADWVDWATFRDEVLRGERAVSPWCVEQVVLLSGLGDEPGDWPAADVRALPPAAR